MDSSTIFFQRLQQVSGGVMSLGATTAGLVNLSGHYIANPQGAALDASEVDKEIHSFLTSSIRTKTLSPLK